MAYDDVQIVRQHIDTATDWLARHTASEFKTRTVAYLRDHAPVGEFESPLEVLFWVWWRACCSGPLPWVDALFELEPQREVRLVDGTRYRVDFLVRPFSIADDPRWVPIAVELDGHAFHERTREQVASRDSRDRALQKAGWTVFHYSFSEFTANPADCIGEVLGHARQQWNHVSLSRLLERRKQETTVI